MDMTFFNSFIGKTPVEISNILNEKIMRNGTDVYAIGPFTMPFGLYQPNLNSICHKVELLEYHLRISFDNSYHQLAINVIDLEKYRNKLRLKKLEELNNENS